MFDAGPACCAAEVLRLHELGSSPSLEWRRHQERDRRTGECIVETRARVEVGTPDVRSPICEGPCTLTLGVAGQCAHAVPFVEQGRREGSALLPGRARDYDVQGPHCAPLSSRCAVVHGLNVGADSIAQKIITLHVDMRKSHDLDDLNLNQMAALDALLTERNVRRAAMRFGVSQSAMSHTLASLRTTMGDPLLVRSGNAMIPTPRAEAIQAPLHRALADLRAAVQARPGFTPQDSKRRFVIACSDAVAVTLIPALAKRLAKAAPSVELELRAAVRHNAGGLLESGEVDVLISPMRPSAPGVKARRLYGAGWQVVCRRRHPKVRSPLDLDTFCALAHAVVGTGRGPSLVDHALEASGRARNVTLVIPYFMAASAIVECTDHLITLPDGLADQLVRGRRLQRHPLPLDLAAARVFMSWHERFDDEPGAKWLRELLVLARTDIES